LFDILAYGLKLSRHQVEPREQLGIKGNAPCAPLITACWSQWRLMSHLSPPLDGRVTYCSDHG